MGRNLKAERSIAFSSRPAVLWLTLASLTAANCSGGGEPTESAGQVLDHGAVEQLLALGYLDNSPDEPSDKQGAYLHDADRVQPGYTLYTVRKVCLAQLIDLEGQVVHSWQPKACERWDRAEIFADGELGVTDTKGRLQWFSWDGDLLWEKEFAAHHDQEITPDGNIAVLTAKFRIIPAVSFWRRTEDNYIRLLDPRQNTVGELSLYDVLAHNDIGFRLLGRHVMSGARTEVDLLHANSVEWIRAVPGLDQTRGSLYEIGNVLVSIRHQDTAVIVNWPRKELVWAWGQGQVSAPHHASLLDNGNILLFDNGTASGRSRVVELNPVSREIEWSYDGGESNPFFTRARGSAQRLANGNTLVAVSDTGWIFEVTKDGDVVWEFWNPLVDEGGRTTIIRAMRYDTKLIEGWLQQ